MASPSGRVGEEDNSSSRGVPIELAATTTTRAGSKCSPTVAVVSTWRRSPGPRRSRSGARVRPSRASHRAIAFGRMRQVGRCLGALVAARSAGAALDARSATVVGDRVDRVELRPPVPAQLRLTASDFHAVPTRSGAAASGRPRCRADRPDRRAGRRRRTGGRSGRSTAAARSSRSASRRRRRRASGRGSRTAAPAARRRRR